MNYVHTDASIRSFTCRRTYVFISNERNKMRLHFTRRWNMNVCIRMLACLHLYTPGLEEFIKYEICCEGKHGSACNMRCKIYIPERLFTVRLLKVFAYILTASAQHTTLCVVVVVVSNCIDITSRTRARAHAFRSLLCLSLSLAMFDVV